MPSTAPFANPLKSLFSLDPAITFLNHGSFGATPLAVQQEQARWRTRMEAQPVRFLGRELPGELRRTAATIAPYFGAQAQDLTFVPNATYGVNLIARSLERILQPGDEILATNHEYGACSNAWEAVCARTGARYMRQPIPMPDEEHGANRGSAQAIVDALLAGITSRTRVLYLSHITSPTALLLPVAELVAAARTRGILSVVDGAHAPGQIALDLNGLGADFYTGNCHKWLCAPKGSAILHVRRAQQHLIEPLVVSWGSPPEQQHTDQSAYQNALIWSGTADATPYLCIPAAIEFQQQHEWDAVRAQAAARLDTWLPRYAEVVKMPPIYAGAGNGVRPPQLAVTPIPATWDMAWLKQTLYEEYAIEIPAVVWRGRHFLRISVQGYNRDADLAHLHAALRAIAAAPRHIAD